jgi:hypothetical protein
VGIGPADPSMVDVNAFMVSGQIPRSCSIGLLCMDIWEDVLVLKCKHSPN